MSAVSVQSHFPLQALNTFGMDVFADAYAAIHSPADLMTLRADPTWAAQPVLVLGAGSNLLLTGNVGGLVLHMRTTGKEVVGEDHSSIYVRAAAGEDWHTFVLWTLEAGYAGLENLSLIPGTVGAAPVQNIGAYGVELQERFHALRALDWTTGEIKTFDHSSCRFSYRDSFFRRARGRFIIMDVVFALPKRWQNNLSYPDVEQAWRAQGAPPLTPLLVSRIIADIRRRKLPDPAVAGNAGSFFKNPSVSRARFEALRADYPDMPGYIQADGYYRLAAGWLIEQCGWKGKTVGDVGVWETQALVLVNRGKACGQDIARVSLMIQEAVNEKFGVWLEPEPVFV
ncbi:MAG: UDP-N-acetylmuramate dehydrogenase [Burkholderiaceae bacterium]|jgi:UDP-N-acetylmuramate dehydrogenase|nr:UDP-N-acetylmuramate dehydrogenase [Burkholderiaceae bacterium]